MNRVFNLKGEYIKLGQLLKAAGLVSMGTEAKAVIENGEWCVEFDGTLPAPAGQFSDIYQSLLFGDFDRADKYYLFYDFQSYDHTLDQVFRAYEDRPRWNRMAVHNTARAGFFSSDRTIEEYNRLIWHLQPLKDHGNS